MSKKIKIKDIDVKEIISSYAKALKVKFEEDNNEYYLRIPKSLGIGYIKGTHFTNGVGVIVSDYRLKKDITIETESGLIHPLKIIFNRESSITHQFQEFDEEHKIGRFENAMIAGTSKNENVFTIKGNKPISIFSIQINRKLFESKIETFLSSMNEDLVTLFRDVNGVNTFFYKEHYSLNIAKYIKEYMECENSDFIRSVYLEGKAYEILTHQIQQYLDDLNEPKKRKILRQSTIENIENAVKIIHQEIESLDSIINLAKRVGLNQNILQNGFQQLYKTTVKEYISNYRLEKAKELLEISDLNITEITYKIGINSRSYFSKIFKQRYGILPKQYRLQLLEKGQKVESG